MAHPQAVDLSVLERAHRELHVDDVRPRARLIVTSRYGAVEMEVADARVEGVLFAGPGPIGVGGVHKLKVLCPPHHAFSDAQGLRVEILAIDDDATPGHRHVVVPGLELEVAFGVADASDQDDDVWAPVVVGEALAPLDLDEEELWELCVRELRAPREPCEPCEPCAPSAGSVHFSGSAR